jgi:hypothetical protein
VIISEVTPWGSGNTSYAADWFELTNTGSSAVDITGWKFDDNSNSAALAVSLTGVTSIAAGQSVVFIEGSASTAAAFTTTWFGASPPPGFAIGTYSGSGVGLSTGGDAVNIYDASNALVSNVTFGVSDATAPFQTFDNSVGATGAISTLSQTGTNGAFVAAGDANEIGSPGTWVVATGTSTTTDPNATTTSPTIPGGTGYAPWPGSPTVQTASNYVFGGNLSGLDYEGTGSSTPGVLWGARNGPGTLFRLVWDGSNWTPDPANGWANGKLLHYPNGSGDPDSEGVTMVGDHSDAGMYVSTERDNTNGGVSRLSVLRFDPSQSGTTLTATNDWNLTADLPPTGQNLGLEAITWIDDAYLTANNFYDQGAQHTYNPADYPDHGTGLFFVGVEGSGTIYAYALDQHANTFHKVATFPGGFGTIMELQFDRDTHDLWAVCDDTCQGRTAVFRLNSGTGAFERVLGFERPAGMPNINNEGFAIAPATYCVDGFKPVFWADDSETDGHSVRSGTLPCAVLTGTPPSSVPELPFAPFVVAAVTMLLAGALLIRRHRGLRAPGTDRMDAIAR